MLVFVEGGKPEYPEKNPRSRDENQQQTQPTYDTETRNRTQATLVGGECSHHCAIPASCFAMVTKEEIISINEAAVTKNTKMATKFSLTALNGKLFNLSNIAF